MSRIRSIKPDAGKDAALWDAEVETGLPLFRAFSMLWCQADREGRFEWKPRELKVECLPYWDGDFSRVLDALAARGFIVRYEVDGRSYAYIRNFLKHQFINGKEPKSRLPAPPKSAGGSGGSGHVANTSPTGGSHVPDTSSSGASPVVDAPIPIPSQSLPNPDPNPSEGVQGEPQTTDDEPEVEAEAAPVDPRVPMTLDWVLPEAARQGLLTELVPAWAIDAIWPQARTHYAQNPDDRRRPVEWVQDVVKWIRRDFRDPKRRPEKPADEGSGAARQRELEAQRQATIDRLNAEAAAAKQGRDTAPERDPRKLVAGIGNP